MKKINRIMETMKNRASAIDYLRDEYTRVSTIIWGITLMDSDPKRIEKWRRYQEELEALMNEYSYDTPFGRVWKML